MSQTKRAPVFIAVLEYGEVPELVRAAEILAALERDILFFFAKPNYRRLAQDGALVSGKGFRWIDAEGRPGCGIGKVQVTNELAGEVEPVVRPDPQVSGRKNGIILRTTRTLATRLGLRAALVDLVNLLADFRRFRQRNRNVQRIVAQHRPSLVVVGQSVVGSELDMVLAAAQRLGCPSLIVPFAMFNLEELATFALRRPEHHASKGLLNRLLAKFFPHWVVQFGGKRLLRLPGSRGLALQLAGLVHGLPWVPCSGPATAIACESTVAAHQFEAMGLNAKLLTIVGGPVHDQLARHVKDGSTGRQQIVDELGLSHERPILLCGWPANIFPWLGGKVIAFHDYSSLAHAWAALLARAATAYGVNVIVSVHPKTLEAELEAPRRAGLAVVKGGSDRLVAHSDVFCTLNGSSITAWAIACRKPTVLFDCYETGYPEFEAVPGVLMTRSQAEFEQAIARVFTDVSFRAELAAKQDTVAADWGRLDGRARERLIALARRLLGQSTDRQAIPARANA